MDQVVGDGVCILRARERFGARERNEKTREIETSERVETSKGASKHAVESREPGGCRSEGGGGGGRQEDGRRTTTITLKAVRDTPAMVLICRSRFPSPRCHGFHGVLVIIRTFRPPSTFASRPPPPPLPLSLFLRRHLFPPPLPPRRFHHRRYLANQPASGRRLVYLITGM